MLQRFAVFLIFAATQFAANTRLYLTDGNFHLVKEYEVNGQRVRYLSAERNEWEQLPLAMVDLKRTTEEAEERESAMAAELAIEAEEDEALRKARAQIAKIPVNFGVYYIDGEDLVPLATAEVEQASSATRKILQVLAPAPIVPSKVTITVEGKTAEFRVKGNRPEFYFRLAVTERFAIIKLPEKGDGRLVETVEIVPESEAVWETMELVDAFRQQLDDRLYRIWPQADMEPGEYALVEYTEGEMNVRVWPFGVDAAGE